MADSFAILRTEKLKTSEDIISSVKHTLRLIETKNADPKIKNLILYGNENIAENINNRLEEIRENSQRKIRKDAVLCIEYLQTASPDFFKNPEFNMAKWTEENVNFLKEKHGKNLISCVLHLDETTPHIVSYVIPEKDGQLNCKFYLGGKQKLSKLQDDYSEKMSIFDLKRGIKNSSAKHKTIKEFYSELNTKVNQSENNFNHLKKLITKQPIKKLLQSEEKYNEIVKNHNKKLLDELKKLTDYSKKIELKNIDLKNENNNIKRTNNRLSEENESLTRRIIEMSEELNLSKEDIQELRKTNVTLVAKRLDYYGEIQKKENAIDLVKRVNSFTYNQAVAWLYNEIGIKKTVDEIAEYQEKSLREINPDRPLTYQEIEIKKQVKQQLDAIDCEKYRITCMSENNEQATFLMNKKGDKERFYSKEQVIDLIPALRYFNNKGYNIFITPQETDCYYILLDDCRLSFDDMKKVGLNPCVYQQTSWQSYQAVFKVPNSINRDVVNNYFKELNKKHGDIKISGLKHGFRLAGFKNVKEKHKRINNNDKELNKTIFPFVKVLHSFKGFCQKTVEILLKREEKHEQLLLKETDKHEKEILEKNVDKTNEIKGQAPRA